MRPLRPGVGSALLAALALTLLAGCGGGSGSAPSVASVSLTIHWPSQTGLGPAAMPPATEVIQLTLTRDDVIIAQTGVARATDGSDTTATMLEIPVGDSTLNAYAYSYDPNTVIADAHQVITVLGGVDNPVSVELMPTLNTAPVPTFTVTPPTSINAGSDFTVDASGSTDAETATDGLQVRWDWTNDGTYDTSWTTTKTATHSYPTYGMYTIGLEVRDPAWLSATTTRQVYIVYVPPGPGT
jgi:hypothetical protein